MRYLLIVLLLFIGCDEDSPTAPESVYGCTNQSACNFNSNATIFDDTCIYAEEDCLGNCGGSAVVDGCGVCNGGGSSCEFASNITLTNNSIPTPNADVFIRYACNDIQAMNGEGCSNTLFRSGQAIGYHIPNPGLVRLYEYDLDNNLIRTLIDEYHDVGTYTFYYQTLEYFAPFNLSVVKIVLEQNDNIVEKFSILDATADFNASLNLGQTNESGEFILDSNYIKSYNLPTFYNIPGYQGMDVQGNFTDFYTFSEAYNNLHIYFLYDGVYKRFDIDLQNFSYNYSFEWSEGEIFNAPTLNSNDNNQNYRDTENDLPTEMNLYLYPNPFY